MKKTATILLTLALSASTLLGEVPKNAQEARALIQEGKALKLPDSPKKRIRNRNMLNKAIISENKLNNELRKLNGFKETKMNETVAPPMKVTAGGSSIYGFCNFSNDETVSPIGLYTFEPDGIRLKWRDNFIYSEYYTIDSGFLLDDQLIGSAIYDFMGYVFGYSRLVFDFETGALLSRIDYDFSDPNVIMYELLAYNTMDSYVYGIASEQDMKYYFYRTTPADLSIGEKLAEVPDDITALCYNEIENAFIALNTSGQLEKIDVDGSVTPLFKLDLPIVDFRYLAGLVFSPVEKVYYASLSAYNEFAEGYLAVIDVENKKIRNLWQLEYANQFKTMVTTDEADEMPLKPQTPTIAKISFENGSTSGYIDFLMPSETMDSTPMEGTIHAFPSVNGVPVGPAEGFATTPGAKLHVEYTDLPEGKDSFKIYINDGTYSSRTLTNSFWVGNDTPLEPTKVVLTDNKVSWKAVTKGVNKGFVATKEMSYKVYLNDEYVGETTDTSMELSLPTDCNYTAFRATVVAVCRGKESAPAVSNSVISGHPYNLPLYFEASEENEELCTVINSNHDPAYWIYNMAYKAFNIGYCTIGNNDDWLILPAFNATSTDTYYTLTFETSRFLPDVKEEFLSVYCGATPTVEGMATEIIPTFSPTPGLPEFEKITVLFKASEIGKCHIGFHCTSSPNQFGLLIKNIHILDNNVTEESPAQVLNLDAQPFEDGELKATVSFNLPRKRIDGGSISKDTEVSAYIITNDTIKVSGHPGERVSAIVNTRQGNNLISVMSAIGDLGSLNSEINVYTGVVPPDTPVITDLYSSPDMQSLTLEWNPVTTGVNGGYVDPSDIKYSIYTMTYDIWGNQIWKEHAQVGKATEYTYTCQPDTPLQFFYLGVASYNAAGSNGGVRAQIGQIGTPYTLPISENFTYGFLEMPTWMSLNPFNDYTVDFQLKEVVEIDGLDIDAEYLLMAIGEAGKKGRLAVPRFNSFNIEGAQMALTLYTGENAAPVNVYAGYTGAPKLIHMGSVAANPEGPDFTTVYFNLPTEALGKNWVQIYIDTELVDASSLCLIKEISVAATSGVSDVNNSACSISGGKGEIILSGLCGEKISVYNGSGMKIAEFTVGENMIRYPLTPGIYIVSTEKTTSKVMVR